MLSAKEVAALAAKALDAKMGEDIRLIGITDISTLADFFLICTATSSTHVKTLCDAVEEAMDEAGEPMLSREGHRGGTWVLNDPVKGREGECPARFFSGTRRLV